MAGQLFPRYTQSAATRPLASAGPVLSLSPDMQRALHSDWMTSLQSVYQLVKARQCPFFYLLAPNFRWKEKSANIFLFRTYIFSACCSVPRVWRAGSR